MQVIRANPKKTRRTLIAAVVLAVVVFTVVIYFVRVPVTNSYFTWQSEEYKYEIEE